MADLPHFDHRMSDAEGLMWRLEKDPHLSSTFANVTILDRAPDFDRLMRRIAAMLPESHRGAYGAGSEGSVVVLREARERPARSPRDGAEPEDDAANEEPPPAT